MSDAIIPVRKDEYDRLKVEAELSEDHRRLLKIENDQLRAELRVELTTLRQQYVNLRDQYDELAEENKTLRIYYKDWCDRNVRNMILPPQSPQVIVFGGAGGEVFRIQLRPSPRVILAEGVGWDEAAREFWNGVARMVEQKPLFPEDES